LEDKTPITYPLDRSIIEMQRNSKEKEQLYQAGLIRPFLFLVSMHPLTRYSLAKTMKIRLEKYEKFGDSHFEAWQILYGHESKGLQGLVNRKGQKRGNWFSILSHVLTECMDTSSRISGCSRKIISQAKEIQKKFGYKISLDKNDSSMKALEESYLICLYEVMQSIRAEHQLEIPAEWRYTLDLAYSEVVEPWIEKLTLFGEFKHEGLMRMLVAVTLRSRVFHMTHNLQGWKDRKRRVEYIKNVARIAIPATTLTVNLALAATPIMNITPLILLPVTLLTLNVSKTFMAKDSPIALLLPISTIISQREILAYHDISIDEYYPVKLS